MSRFNAHPSDETLAVLHQAGQSSRVLIATAAGRTISIVESVEFPRGSTEGLAAGLEARLLGHKVDRIIAVVPASGVVCRTCSLPQADAQQLQEVLELQAEGQFQGHTPDHRVAMSVLPAAPGETSRTGIVLSWPETATGVAPSLDSILGGAAAGSARNFCPDIAGLAALLNGVRPMSPLIWLDRENGAVAIALTHANGAIFRCTREEAGPAGNWQERLGRALAETAMSVGHSGAFVEGLVGRFREEAAAIGEHEAALLVPSEILASASKRFDGAPSDGRWWSTYGIAAGVVLAATGELTALTTLESAPRVEKPSRWRSIAETISRPRAALVTTLVCLAVLALTPPAMNGLRLGVLKLRHPDILTQAAAVGEAREQLAMYSALEREAWSMTKILADIASCTPEGIDLKSIRIQHSDATFAVGGLARPNGGLSAPDVVARMQENLRDSRLFHEVRLNWDQPNNFKQQEFELSAKVVSPHRQARYAIDLDFERYPLDARERGEGPPAETTGEIVGDAADLMDDPAAEALAQPASEPASGRAAATPAGSAPEAVAADSRDADDPSESRNSLRRPRTGVGGGAADGAADRSKPDERTGETVPGLDDAPEPLSAAQIAAMTKSEVQNRLSVVATARDRARRAKDEELEERLKTEFNALLARLRELK